MYQYNMFWQQTARITTKTRGIVNVNEKKIVVKLSPNYTITTNWPWSFPHKTRNYFLRKKKKNYLFIICLIFLEILKFNVM